MVDRYWPVTYKWGEGSFDTYVDVQMEEVPTGDWVKIEDYEKLEKKLADIQQIITVISNDRADGEATSDDIESAFYNIEEIVFK